MGIIYLGLINVSILNSDRFKVKEATKNLFHTMIRRLHPASAIDLEVKTGPHGKPYLPRHPSWYFNVSHAGRMGACAIARIPLGIDIELIDERRHWKTIAEHFYHNREIAYLSNQAGNSCAVFYHLWTRKESWLKLHDMTIWQTSQAPCCLDLSDTETDVWTWQGSGCASFSLSLRINSDEKKYSVRFIEEFIPEGIHLQQVSLKGGSLFCRSE
ncbi:MAG: 4'-phosphopantetheinyl transferase superfamily protein [Spirochaetales bacterium]|nr:4'-phosphopantetheinyl transferase superfamily protein [Spirochaetales bacterium]